MIRTQTLAWTFLAALVVIAVSMAGCSRSAVYAGSDYRVEIADLAGESGQVSRERVVEAAREVLTDHRFVLDRVDARRGVVTTAFKSTQGLASPWDSEQNSLREESADLVNQHERGVRVSIDDEGAFTVSVIVQRVHRPAWRVETESISQSTHAVVIDSNGRAVASRQITPIGLDGELARRLGQEISARLISK